MSKASSKRDDDHDAKAAATNREHQVNSRENGGDNIRSEPTKDLQANESQARAKGEYGPAKAARQAINDLSKAVDDIEKSDRRARDLVAIRDARDEAKAVLQRLEQYVVAL